MIFKLICFIILLSLDFKIEFNKLFEYKQLKRSLLFLSEYLLKKMIRYQMKELRKKLILITCLLIFVTLTNSYIDIPLKIVRPQNKSGQIAYNFEIDISGYKQNISIVLNNAKEDSITSVGDMKTIYKEKKLKRGKYNTQKNHKNVFGVIESTSLQGYTFQGWKRFFMEVFLYIQSRYYHDIQINLDDIPTQEIPSNSKNLLSHGIMTLGPKLLQNKIYQEIKKNTDLINDDIIAIYSGIGQRNNRLQLGGYEQEYARGDAKTGALLFQFPLKVNEDYWQLAVQKVFFTRSKNRKTDEFLINPTLSLYKLSIESQYIVFPQSMRNYLQSYVESENNECKIGQFLECNNMSTIDISLSEFAFQLTPNYFINISLYDLRRSFDSQTKKVSFYIKLSPNVSQVQIGSVILKEYYIAIDMNKSNLLFSTINRFGTGLSSVHVMRFFLYFFIFTVVMALIVGIWANFSDPTRRNKVQYGREGIQLITYQRPGGIFTTNNQFDD